MPRKDDIKKKYHTSNPRSPQYRESSNTGIGFSGDDLYGAYDAWRNGPKNAWEGRMDSEYDYWLQSFLMAIPGVSGVLQGNWSKQALEHYMKNYGLTWNDLISRNIFGGQFSNAAAVKNTTNFVSDMIKELYS